MNDGRPLDSGNGLVLVQFRVRCLDGMEDSGWLKLEPGGTVFRSSPARSGSTILQALQHINAPGNTRGWHAFFRPLTFILRNGHYKKVYPHKKTAALAVFAAEEPLVRVLATIDEDLYATDRIEIGRRLDYSRWLNFIGIPSAVRWGEIAGPMRKIGSGVAVKCPHLRDGAARFRLDDFKASDRIRGKAAADLLEWLRQSESCLEGGEGPQCSRCRWAIEKPYRFARAGKVVRSWLPYFVLLRPHVLLHGDYAITELERALSVKTADPVVQLLSDLWASTGTGGAEDERRHTFQHRLRTSAARLAQTGEMTGLLLPRFRISGEAVNVDFPRRNPGRLQQKLDLLAAVLVLSVAINGHLPVLLLDEFAEDLSGHSAGQLVRYMRSVGSTCQLLYATTDDSIACREEWAGVIDCSRTS